MAIRPKRGSFVHLEDVRVFYDRKADRISLTSGDRDLPEAGGLKIDVSPGTQSERQLRELLKAQGVIEEDIWPKTSREDTLRFIEESPESSIHLGTTIDGRGIRWSGSVEWSYEDDSPILWSHGRPGDGASRFARLMAEHGFRHDWEIYGLDPKRAMVGFGGDGRQIELTHDPKEMLSALRSHSELQDRLRPDGSLKRVLILVDDLECILDGLGEREGALFLEDLGVIARLGRSMGVLVQLNSEWPSGLSRELEDALFDLWEHSHHCFVGNYPVDRIPKVLRSSYSPGRGRGSGRAQYRGRDFEIGNLS